MGILGYDTIDKNGTAIEHVSFMQTTFGVALTEDRAAYLATSLDNFALKGVVTDGFLAVGVGTNGYSGSDGSNKRCEVDDNVSTPPSSPSGMARTELPSTG
ncbi:hypothetical protein [Streptomyces sp.]|uniref:hypothetical protein n=1 Tax=Streptomyces sp. TaxID=1931 RepID=UPI002D7A06FB|nr:hypothetical protein [Streptomyces sp.]HET6356972.1 hypothetical protein [Streptomyces sp.]